jgi:putative NADH-flavin reductase
MRLAIVGATGGTGREVTRQALERGHEVLVLARRPDAVGPAHPRLTVRPADATRPDELEAGLDGAQALISALGVSRRELLGPVTLYTRTGEALLEALRRRGLRRFVAVTSGGVEDHDPSYAFFYKWVIRPLLLRRAYADLARFEAQVRATDLQWTLVRPTALTDGPATRQYRVSPQLSPPGGTQISRADLAGFLLDTVEQGSWIGETPTLAY